MSVLMKAFCGSSAAMRSRIDSMNRLQWTMAGLDRFTQCTDRGNRSAGITYLGRQSPEQAAEGLLRIAMQGHGARVEVVELARVDVRAAYLVSLTVLTQFLSARSNGQTWDPAVDATTDMGSKRSSTICWNLP